MDINYELYKVFYYVASTLSFSEASKQLFISQSAVSQSIKALEKKLDQTLFIRSTKKVRLTTEDSFTSEPVIRSAVISWCLIWNASTGNFRERISRLRMRHRSAA